MEPEHGISLSGVAVTVRWFLLINSQVSHEIQPADVFTLVNRHKKPMDVVVIEASPVATAEEIKVQATFAPQPGVTSWEQRRGVVAWKAKLAAGETARFNVAYSIDFPKEGVMIGLR